MLQLEDVRNKENLFKHFFEWLFNDNRIVNNSIHMCKDIDLSLCTYYQDPYIYYPEQIKAFFETSAMKGLGRISQLDLTINDNPNAFHNRLEHSKGVYYKKLEELFYNFQNPDWKKYIENNNLKLTLIAELIKMAGHDIGHTPLSHAIERETLGRKGLHEEVGKRIMLEDSEIQQALLSISPDLPKVLANLYDENILNFREHDESNYDVDRLDYLNRDNLYIGSRLYLPLQQYKSVCVAKDENGLPIHNSDFSISQSTSGNGYIDVYDYGALSEIEKTFSLRLQRYSHDYIPPEITSLEKTIPILLQYLEKSKSATGQNLREYLSYLSITPVSGINLSIFLSWDEIKFNLELLDIAENHENPHIREMATMLIPRMDSFLNLIYSHLNMHSKSHDFSENELDLLRKIKHLIKGNSELSKNLKKPNYAMDNIIFVPEGTMVFSDSGDSLTQSFYTKISAYNTNEPIYIRDSSGKIYELSHHPNRQCDWDKQEVILKSTFLIVPQLRLNGFTEEDISAYKKLLPDANNPSIKNKNDVSINMQPLQVGHNMADEFELEL